jgi:hypothetical protein
MQLAGLRVVKDPAKKRRWAAPPNSNRNKELGGLLKTRTGEKKGMEVDNREDLEDNAENCTARGDKKPFSLCGGWAVYIYIDNVRIWELIWDLFNNKTYLFK